MATTEERLKYIQEAVNTILHQCSGPSLVDAAMRNAARFVQNAIDGEPPEFEELPKGGDISDGYLAVVRPVRHVLRRHHRERLDALVGVVRLDGRLVVLLLVVRSVDEEASVVFHRGRVRAEVVVEQRIPIELAVLELWRSRREGAEGGCGRDCGKYFRFHAAIIPYSPWPRKSSCGVIPKQAEAW